MLPTIVMFKHVIGMYGLCILIGVVLGILVALYYGKKRQVNQEDVFFSSLYGIIGVVAGGKLLFLITNFSAIAGNWKKIISDADLLKEILVGGFVFYGGLLGGFLGIFLYCRQYHISPKKIFICILPSVPLIHAFGRIGCFMAGCCYGIEYHGFASVTFHHPAVGAAPAGVPLFPVQLVESGINLMIFLVLVFFMKRGKSLGHVLLAYLFLYSISRFMLEFVRGDVVRGFLWKLSTSQWISMLCLMFCVFYLLVKRGGKNEA